MLSRRAFLTTAAASAAVGALSACISRDQHLLHLHDPSPVPVEGGTAPIAARLGRRWPGEWERHASTLMSMPYRTRIYGPRLDQVQAEWAAVVAAISRFEPVQVIVPQGRTGKWQGVLGPEVKTHELPYDDAWIRDNGPIVVVEPEGVRTGLDWEFNGWGGAFDRFGQTWHKDDRLPPRLLKRMAIAHESVPMVLEGGSVQSDGAGTILTTKECLLDPSRNPSMDRREIEAVLLKRFGADRVVWLPFGLIGDLTAGHVDGVAMWIGPGRVIAQTDSANAAEGERLAENLKVLRSVSDADGNPLDVVEYPLLPRGSFAGLPSSSFTYLNFAFARDGLVVPVTGDTVSDREGLGMLREIITDREILGVPAPALNWAGGGVHCITQQVPALPASPG